jgi:hypothetical protein
MGRSHTISPGPAESCKILVIVIIIIIIIIIIECALFIHAEKVLRKYAVGYGVSKSV